MATKIKINDYGDCVYSEDSVIEQLYQDPTLDISKITVDTKLYNQALTKLQIDLPKLPEQILRNQTVVEFDKQNYNAWHMPESYENIDVKTYLLEKCNTEEERDRVLIEYKLFEQKGFTKVLKFLIYFL